jgi:hypothetical protein
MNFVNRRPPGSTPVRLDRLGPRDCRFPVGGEGEETRFCARPALSGKSWCRRCDRRVHLPLRAGDLEEIAQLLNKGARP